MKTLLYLTNSRLPSEKAHAIQIMKTCSALTTLFDLKLIHAHRKHRDWLQSVTDLQAYYGLQHSVPRKTLYSLDLFALVPKLPSRLQARGYQMVFALQLITYHLRLLTYLVFEAADVYYTRDSVTALLIALFFPLRRKRVFFEAHSFPKSGVGQQLQRWLVPRIGGVSVLTSYLKQDYIALGGTTQTVRVIADAVDLTQFQGLSQAHAREHLSLPQNTKLAVYVGQFYAWKGVDTLVLSAQYLAEDISLYLVGGTPEETPRIEALINNTNAAAIHLIGRVAPTEVQYWMAAADVLVLPNSGKQAVSVYYTSPLKLFEYLAASGAIVASDLPSIREVLTHEETAILVAPDDDKALAWAISRLCADVDLAKQLQTAAGKLAKHYSWDARAQQITQFVNSI